MKIRSEDSIPKGYGIAYILYDKDLAVVLPIPINVIVRSILYIYYILIKAGYPSKWEKKLESVWEYGIEVGRNSRQSETFNARFNSSTGDHCY